MLCQGALFGFCGEFGLDTCFRKGVEPERLSPAPGMLAWIPAVSPPATWFTTKRGLAMGLCVSGAGIGGLALGPLTQLMLDTMGFRWALRIWGIGGGIVCATCATMLKMRVNPPGQLDIWGWARKGNKKTASVAPAPAPGTPKPPMIEWSLFKQTKFQILFVACLWAFFGTNLPYYFIPQYAVGVLGATPGTASVVLGVMNGVSSIGRIALGIVSDKLGAQNVLVISSFVVVIDVFALWLPGANAGIGLLFVFGILYGFFAGAPRLS